MSTCWPNVHWLIALYMITSPTLGMFVIMMINMAMFLIFRKLRKRLDKLKETSEGAARQDISFLQTIGIFKKSFYSDIPGLKDTQIQILEIRNLKSGSEQFLGTDI
jgi:hypothetical protein